MDLIRLLAVLLIGILITAVVYIVAAMFLPHPIPLLLALVCVVAVILYLLGHRGAPI